MCATLRRKRNLTQALRAGLGRRVYRLFPTSTRDEQVRRLHDKEEDRCRDNDKRDQRIKRLTIRYRTAVQTEGES